MNDSSFKILIVDDNKQLADTLLEVFQLNGYKAFKALDGASAIAFAEQETFDLAILDYRLPDMDALELQQKLAQTTKADYLIITAYASVESAAEAVRRKKIVGYETKPLNYEYLLAFVQQIVERRQAEQERDLTAARLSAIFQAIPGYVIVIDKEFIILEAKISPKTMANLGIYSNNELIGKKCHEVFKQQPDVCTGCTSSLCMNSGQHEERFSTPQEDEYLGFSAKIYSEPIRDKNQSIIGAVECAMDITDLKEIEAELRTTKNAAEAANLVKSRFLANMSHEIRTPINAIVGFSNILQDTPLSSEQTSYVKSILASSNILMTIINEILDFSKIEAGMIKLETVTFEVEQVLKDVVNVFFPIAKEKDISFKYEIEGAVPYCLSGDMNRLRQVLLNLIGNAMKFTKQGHIIVSVATVQESDTGATLRFAVEDTGIGIYPAQIPELFKPFTQADESITRQYGGTGLGLSICQTLVKMMGGNIRVQSDPGNGSTFEFTAQFTKPPACSVPETSPETAAEAIAKDTSSIRILIAEDNLFNQKVIQLLLTKLGFVVDIAINGREVLNKLHEQTYHIILMDVYMPEMNGIETAKRIRSAGAAFSSIPIIALTADAVEENQVICSQAGMNDYLIKPVESNKLKEVIFQHLK